LSTFLSDGDLEPHLAQTPGDFLLLSIINPMIAAVNDTKTICVVVMVDSFCVRLFIYSSNIFTSG
jgi:hypothetical protein